MFLKGLEGCTLCDLCEGRKNVVPGDGPSDAEIVIVGLGPGPQEDAQGLPFVGKSGSKLTAALRQANFTYEEINSYIYYTNVVRCIPPNNKLTTKYVKACAPYLD